MYRRVIAAGGAAALLAVALPATPAFAAAAGTATLAASGVEVLPGTQPFEIGVSNTEGMAFLGGGRTVDTVRVILPAEIGIKTTTAPTKSGWTVTRVAQSGLEQYIFRAVAGGGLQPRTSDTFPVPADVARPLSADRTGAFQVGLSSDGGNTFQSATGSLGTTIRTLKVSTLAVVDGPGQAVADGTGTARQSINTRVTVQNFARNAQLVTPTLTSAGGSNPDAVSQATPTDVPGAGLTGPAGATTFTVPVTLGAVTADTARTFTARASSSGSTTGSGAALNASIPYVVQVAPTFNLVPASFKPVAVRRGLSYAFSVTASKQGTPTLALPSGTLTLRNRDNQATVAPISLADGVTFAGGTNSGTFTFTEATVGDALDGRYDALFQFAGTDGNGFSPDPTTLAKSLQDILSVDNLGPIVTAVITLPNDRDGDRTTAARDFKAADGNSITVSGTANDTAAAFQGVQLECLVGGQTILPSSTPTLGTSGGSRTFTATFQPAFGDCGAFRAAARFQDVAGNVGEAFSANVITVDNEVPTIDGLLGAVARFDGVDSGKSSIQVTIADNLTNGADGSQSGVIGGCDPRAYSVDGQLLVQAVFVQEGGAFRECTTGVTNGRAQAKPVNNLRYLRLTSDISRGSTTPTPTISYDPARQGLVPDRLKDAAGNYALAGLQDTLNRLVPAAPTLVTVTRNADKETAFLSNGTYYTRFAGNDLKVTVAGGLAGDRLQLLRNDAVIATVGVANGQGSVNVPLAAQDGALQEFSLRFISSSDTLGDLTPLKVIYDITLPKGASTTRGANGDATVTFTEAVLGGNQALNWSVFEIVKDEEDNDARAFRGVNSVTGAGLTRTISADFTGPAATYGGSLYNFLDGSQYEDFAGNKLAATTEVLASR